MNLYQVDFTASAERELQRIPRSAAKRISIAIDRLASNPRPPGCTKIVGLQQTYRIRVGDYRVIYEVEDKLVTIWVIRVRHRKDAYK